MSKWISKDLEKQIKEKISTIQKRSGNLTDEEIEVLMPDVIAHHKKHKSDNDLFEHEGATILWFEMPVVTAKPTWYKNKDGSDRTNFSCKFKNGFVNIWGSREFWKALEEGDIYWARGKLTVQYDIRGTYGTDKQFSKRQYFTSLEEACEKTGTDQESLDEDDIFKSYTFNVWQNMG